MTTPGGHVLILTPLKNASAFLPGYFAALSKLSYPPELLSIDFPRERLTR